MANYVAPFFEEWFFVNIVHMGTLYVDRRGCGLATLGF